MRCCWCVARKGRRRRRRRKEEEEEEEGGDVKGKEQRMVPQAARGRSLTKLGGLAEIKGE